MASFRVAKSDEVLEGKALEAVIGNEIIAIFRSNAKLYALDGMCAHQGGPLALGRIQNDCVTCPGMVGNITSPMETMQQPASPC